MKYSVAILVLVIILCKSSIGQQSDCKDLLYNYNKSISSISTPQNDKVYFFDVSIEVQMKDQAVGNHKDRIQILLSKDNFQYKSKLLDIYYDTNYTCYILKNQKVIMIGKSKPRSGNDLYLEKIAILRDSIIAQCNLFSCKHLNVGKGSTEIILIPPPKVKKEMSIEKLKFIFSDIDQSLVRSEILSVENNTIINYNKLNLDYTETEINKNTEFAIFSSKNKLKDQYTGYQLIDNR